LYGFDGYVWLRDGSPIAGQTGQNYTPDGADVGHRLSCRITVTYPVPFLVSASATSSAITVRPPALSRLRVSPRTFSLTGRRVAGRCVAVTNANRTRPICRRPIRLRVTYKLPVATKVTFTIKRVRPGRLVKGRCVAPTRANRHRPHCTRLVALRGKITRSGKAGNNRFTFKGRIGGHRLGPGIYRLIATSTANGLSGPQRTVTFRIVP
jgi:hypothetical protein